MPLVILVVPPRSNAETVLVALLMVPAAKRSARKRQRASAELGQIHASGASGDGTLIVVLPER